MLQDADTCFCHDVADCDDEVHDSADDCDGHDAYAHLDDDNDDDGVQGAQLMCRPECLWVDSRVGSSWGYFEVI